jgi:hypothetical protein
MGRLGGNARAHSDAQIITTELEARRLCTGGAVGWAATRDAIFRRDGALPCYRCGTPIRWDLSGLEPSGPTIEHCQTQVADCVGWTRGDARRTLHDMTPGALAVSHRACNSRAGRGALSQTTGGNDCRTGTAGEAEAKDSGRHGTQARRQCRHTMGSRAAHAEDWRAQGNQRSGTGTIGAATYCPNQ